MVTNPSRYTRPRLPKKVRLAADRAQETDRVWFAEHPGHSRYCRWALPRKWDHDPFTEERVRLGSIPRHWSASDRSDARLLVLVVKIYEGARVRQPLFALRPSIATHEVPEVLWSALETAAHSDPIEQGLGEFWRWLAYWGDRLGTDVEPWLLEAEAIGLPVRRITAGQPQPRLTASTRETARSVRSAPSGRGMRA
jgi:hypothetical protein